MLVDFEDFDNVWSKFEDFGNQIYNNVGVPLYNASEQVSTVVRDNADKVYIVAMIALNVVTVITEPLPYLIGFTISLGVNSLDSAFSNRFNHWFDSFFPDDTATKVSLLSTLGFISLALYPPLFAFEMGLYAGRKVVDIGEYCVERIQQYRASF